MSRPHDWRPGAEAPAALGLPPEGEFCDRCGLCRRRCDDLGRPAYQLAWNPRAGWWVATEGDHENGGCQLAPR